MDIISQVITNPTLLLLIGLLFFVAYLLLRKRAGDNLRPRALLWPGVAWVLWAIWEFGIARVSPEANIRVDLLLIIPVVLVVTILGIVRLFWIRQR
jgi:hypothetical protein